jgi:hypothetical protein
VVGLKEGQGEGVGCDAEMDLELNESLVCDGRVVVYF